LIAALVRSTLCAKGFDVVDLGLATTPTVEVAVKHFEARGGVIVTASHNPAEWNALKLLNDQGEFISQEHGQRLMQIVDQGGYAYAAVTNLGRVEQRDFLGEHIQAILALPLVRSDLIRAQGYAVAIDAVNSVGGFAVPALLKALGIEHVHKIHCEVTGAFAHNPEPLPEHLADLSQLVVDSRAHIGISVDPDVDRMALVCEDGEMFGEEYGLVAVADYVLSHTAGNTVSNLSSTRGLSQVTEARGGKYFASAVGEVNVVRTMKDVRAVIGGEGNGGIIYPELHYGRDALVGIALFLSALAESGGSVSQLRARYPRDVIAKKKLVLNGDSADWLDRLQSAFAGQSMDDTDGLRISFGNDWVHVRKSNTEPIVRVYAESDTAQKASELAERIISVLS
jgi:phosphomannomutase